MTIGDEKVVAYRWWKEWPEDFHAVLGKGEWHYGEMPATWVPDNAENLMLRSAYAELAAEKDERIEELKALANHLIAEKANAESQLAELRGRVVALCDHYEQTEITGSPAHVAALRFGTLAAADGG